MKDPKKYTNKIGMVIMVTKYDMSSVFFDKLIWCTIGPKSDLFGTAQFSPWASGAVNYDQ